MLSLDSGFMFDCVVHHLYFPLGSVGLLWSLTLDGQHNMGLLNSFILRLILQNLTA